MFEELENDRYRHYALVHLVDRDAWHVAVTENIKYYSPIAKMMLDSLNKGHCGIYPIKEAVSIRSGKKKTTIKKDRQFIVCHTKQQCKAYSKSNGRVEWDHSVSVRGHWRRQFCTECKGSGCTACESLGLRKGFLGKDRQGRRTIPGKTWITHTIKNPDSNPLKKVRKVTSI